MASTIQRIVRMNDLPMPARDPSAFTTRRPMISLPMLPPVMPWIRQ